MLRYSVISLSAAATLDLERLVRDMDVQSLQENVMNVAFCDIEREVSLNVYVESCIPVCNSKTCSAFTDSLVCYVAIAILSENLQTSTVYLNSAGVSGN